MDFCSFFLDHQGIFGKYPSQDEVIELEKRGITLFVDLTSFNEGLSGYKCSSGIERIHYYIDDCQTPTDLKSFHQLIHCLVFQLRLGRQMYIHCRCGHGRSGLVVACILKIYNQWDSETALSKTNEYHNARIEMDLKLRKRGAPQTRSQKEFVRCF